MTRYPSAYIATALAISTLGAGCAATSETEGVANDLLAPVQVVVTESDQGKAIAVIAGQKLVVSLRNADGYSWYVKESGALGKAFTGLMTANDAPEPRATFEWKTSGKVGTYKVSLAQVRLAAPTPPKATFSFTVNVTKAGGSIGDLPGKECFRSGCSGEVCTDEAGGGMTPCVFRPEFACYASAKCARQADGACGFTQSPTLAACLKNPPAP
jgi:hypothetical protein